MEKRNPLTIHYPSKKNPFLLFGLSIPENFKNSFLLFITFYCFIFFKAKTMLFKLIKLNYKKNSNQFVLTGKFLILKNEILIFNLKKLLLLEQEKLKFFESNRRQVNLSAKRAKKTG